MSTLVHCLSLFSEHFKFKLWPYFTNPYPFNITFELQAQHLFFLCRFESFNVLKDFAAHLDEKIDLLHIKVFQVASPEGNSVAVEMWKL